MTRWQWLLKNLWYFRSVNLAVVAGMAVATAVLAGALLVGDSVRGSLRRLALQRLGPVDVALISQRFFPQTLVDRLQANATVGDDFDLTPAMIVRGGASSEISTSADVQIAALGTARPTRPVSSEWFVVPTGKCIINGELADALGVKAAGESIVLTVPTDSDLPHDSALSRRSRTDLLNGLRVDVAQIVRERGMASLFNPNGGQRVPRNAWVNLADLQDAVDQPDRVNAVLGNSRVAARGERWTDEAAELNRTLGDATTLADFGLEVKPVLKGASVQVGSRQTYLPPQVVEAARSVAGSTQAPLQEISVNLLDSLGKQDQFGPSIVLHYLVAAGVNALDGQPLSEKEIAINQWVADQVGLHVGDTVPVDLFLRGPTGTLERASKLKPAEALSFKITRILPMSGVGADPDLPPDYKGLTDADSVADWNPPEELPIDKKLVTKADEAYWKKYRAAPKVFFNLQTAQQLWGASGGGLSGLRVPAADRDKFLKALAAQLSPAAMGLSFRPIKQEQLAAAQGGTDFSEYFVYFSFFLIVAAVLLVTMLFGLSIEQRARQMGLIEALGFAPSTVRWLALLEGGLLAVVGAGIGIIGSLGYAWLIMAGLRNWWVSAVGTTALQLHAQPSTLVIGFVSGLAVAMLAVLWAVWRLGKLPSARLLAGSWQSPARSGGRLGSVLRWLGIAGMLAGGSVLSASGLKLLPTDVAFLAGGGGILCFALVYLAGWLRPQDRKAAGFGGASAIYKLAILNASRHTARSVLAAGLVAFAVFTLIVVAVMRQGSSVDLSTASSPTGGYALVAETQIPLYCDLNKLPGRKVAGFKDPGNMLWDGAHVQQLHRWAGQDISCLNLTRPTTPTIYSVPAQLIRRKPFTFASSLDATGNPWKLLENDQGDAVPVIADDQTAQYVLNLPVGGEMTINDDAGHPRKLKLVGTLSHSIFQSQLLMGEANFLKLFPSAGGYNVFLIDCWDTSTEKMRHLLGSELEEFSVTVETPQAILAGYDAVVNTYLSTFQTLGSFGLLLGTIGLGVILIRNVIERRGELALLACLGFSTDSRVRLVLAENAFLLSIGLLVGAACAVVGVLPAIIASAGTLNLWALMATLVAVVVVGLGASGLAVAFSGVRVRAADLRRE